MNLKMAVINSKEKLTASYYKEIQPLRSSTFCLPLGECFFSQKPDNTSAYLSELLFFLGLRAELREHNTRCLT